MANGISRLVSLLRDNPDFLPRLLRKSSVRQLIKGASVSRRSAGSMTGIVPGKNTALLVDDGEIRPNGHIVVGTSGPSYLRNRDTMFCIEGGEFVSTSEEILYIGKGTTIFANHGRVNMGDVKAMYGCDVFSTDEVTIGDGCGIGPGVVIRDGHPHTFTAGDERRASSAPVVIEDDVIIPSHALVKKGVTVGEGAVVASGSVVTDDVPPGSLVAGVPAEVIERDVTWEF